MNRFSLKAAAALMGAGLTVGTLAGIAPSAGASTLPLWTTTTSVAITAAPGNNGVIVTATVDLAVLKGLLITPSQTVTFLNTDFEGNVTTLGSAKLSSCLLGLPSLAGITQATCSASIPVANACSLQEVTAIYTSDGDLIAKPSEGSAYSPFCD
jgi:hypothetical protein